MKLHLEDKIIGTSPSKNLRKILSTIRNRIHWCPPKSFVNKNTTKASEFAYFGHVKDQYTNLKDYIIDGGFTFVIGPPSCGKSLIIESIIEELSTSYKLYISRLHALHSIDPISLLNRIAFDLSYSNESKDVLINNEDIEDDNRLSELQAQYSKNRINIYSDKLKELINERISSNENSRIIIIIDNFERLTNDRQVFIYSLIDSISQYQTRISILAVTSDSNIHSKLEKRILSRLPKKQIIIPYINQKDDLIEIYKGILLQPIPNIEDKSYQYNTNWNKQLLNFIHSPSFRSFLDEIWITKNIQFYISILDVALTRITDLTPFINLDAFKYGYSIISNDHYHCILSNLSLLELLLLVEISRLQKILYINLNFNEESPQINFETIYTEYNNFVSNDNNNAKIYRYSKENCWKSFESLLQQGIIRLNKSRLIPVQYQSIQYVLSPEQVEEYLKVASQESKVPKIFLTRFEMEEVLK